MRRAFEHLEMRFDQFPRIGRKDVARSEALRFLLGSDVFLLCRLADRKRFNMHARIAQGGYFALNERVGSAGIFAGHVSDAGGHAATSVFDAGDSTLVNSTMSSLVLRSSDSLSP